MKEGAGETAGGVAALVLAAGASRRFGSQKLLTPLFGRPLVHHAVGNVLASSIDEVLVILGRDSDEVQEALAPLPLRFALNPRYEEGLSRSLHLGLNELAHCEAVLVALGDQPTVLPSTIDALIEAYFLSRQPIVCPIYQGVRGHPVLFDRTVFHELLTVRGDEGGRSVIERRASRVQRVPIDLPVPRDVDTQDDYQHFLKAGLA